MGYAAVDEAGVAAVNGIAMAFPLAFPLALPLVVLWKRMLVVEIKMRACRYIDDVIRR